MKTLNHDRHLSVFCLGGSVIRDLATIQGYFGNDIICVAQDKTDIEHSTYRVRVATRAALTDYLVKVWYYAKEKPVEIVESVTIVSAA